MVVSLHDVSLARARFGRLIGLRDGKVFFDLPNAQVTDDRLAELYGAEPPGSASDDVVSTPHALKISRCF
jgi:phosphonate transport system ATP-binding protein